MHVLVQSIARKSADRAHAGSACGGVVMRADLALWSGRGGPLDRDDPPSNDEDRDRREAGERSERRDEEKRTDRTRFVNEAAVHGDKDTHGQNNRYRHQSSCRKRPNLSVPNSPTQDRSDRCSHGAQQHTAHRADHEICAQATWPVATR